MALLGDAESRCCFVDISNFKKLLFLSYLLTLRSVLRIYILIDNKSSNISRLRTRDFVQIVMTNYDLDCCILSALLLCNRYYKRRWILYCFTKLYG